MWVSWVKDHDEKFPHWRVLAKRENWVDAYEKAKMWQEKYLKEHVSICVLWEHWGHPLGPIEFVEESEWNPEMVYETGAPNPWDYSEAKQ